MQEFAGNVINLFSVQCSSRIKFIDNRRLGVIEHGFAVKNHPEVEHFMVRRMRKSECQLAVHVVFDQ